MAPTTRSSSSGPEDSPSTGASWGGLSSRRGRGSQGLVGTARQRFASLRIPWPATFGAGDRRNVDPLHRGIRVRADTAYLVEPPAFRFYRTESYLKAVCSWSPSTAGIILMGATGLGRDLAGAVATAVGTGLTATAPVLPSTTSAT